MRYIRVLLRILRRMINIAVMRTEIFCLMTYNFLKHGVTFAQSRARMKALERRDEWLHGKHTD